MSVPNLLAEFFRWRNSVDQDHLLDPFDLALGFHAGRLPDAPHSAACDFADRARRTYERIAKSQ